jgi:hypothetical protein
MRSVSASLEGFQVEAFSRAADPRRAMASRDVRRGPGWTRRAAREGTPSNFAQARVPEAKLRGGWYLAKLPVAIAMARSRVRVSGVPRDDDTNFVFGTSDETFCA